GPPPPPRGGATRTWSRPTTAKSRSPSPTGAREARPPAGWPACSTPRRRGCWLSHWTPRATCCSTPTWSSAPAASRLPAGGGPGAGGGAVGDRRLLPAHPRAGERRVVSAVPVGRPDPAGRVELVGLP